jgi:hypothetical protein
MRDGTAAASLEERNQQAPSPPNASAYSSFAQARAQL